MTKKIFIWTKKIIAQKNKKMPTVCPECEKQFISNQTQGKCDNCGYVIEDVQLKKDAIALYIHVMMLEKTKNKMLPYVLRNLIKTFPTVNFNEEWMGRDSSSDEDYEEYEIKTRRR